MKNAHLLVTTLAVLALHTAPLMADPDVVDGVATYKADEKIGKKSVPGTWKKIVIKANVTLTGRFTASNRDTDLIIEGGDKNTSIIKGLPRSEDALDDDKAGIDKSGSGKLTVRNLTVKDQPSRGIRGWGGPLVVSNCKVTQDADDKWTDGIHASAQKGSISGCSINVYDDSTYVTMCDNIASTTFTHRHNGAPFQVSWGYHTGGGNVANISNCTVNHAVKTTEDWTHKYNCGTFDWKGTSTNGDTIKLNITSLTRKTGTGKVAAHKFSFGHHDNEKIAKDAVFKVKGWTWDDSDVRELGNSTGKVESY